MEDFVSIKKESEFILVLLPSVFAFIGAFVWWIDERRK